MRPQRNTALDAMRGLTLAGMILVNTPGSRQYVYWPLAHADWHGYTPTDLIFPFFLFMVGVAMFFSLGRFNYQPTSEALLKIARRVLVIFGIGVLLNAFPFIAPLSELRLMGVLQRIALAYGLVALAVLYLPVRAFYWLIAILLLGYWALLYFGGGAEPYSLQDNVPGHIDRALLGSAHLWQGKGMPFDPEGLFGTLPATLNVMAGFLAARMIVSIQSIARQLRYLLTGGICLVLAGHVWDAWLPINKSLWTSSFALISVGWALLVLAGCVIVDNDGKRLLQPMRIFGRNPLFIYALSSLWVQIYFLIPLEYQGEQLNAYQFLYRLCLQLVANPYGASIFFAGAHVLLLWGVAYFLYRHRIVIKI